MCRGKVEGRKTVNTIFLLVLSLNFTVYFLKFQSKSESCLNRKLLYYYQYFPYSAWKLWKKYVRNEMQLLSLLSENIWNSLAVFLPEVLEKFHLCVSQRNLFAVDVFCQFHQALLLSLKNKALKIVVPWKVFIWPCWMYNL